MPAQEQSFQKPVALPVSQQQPRDYEKPRLTLLGDLRSLTLGVSGAPVDASGGGINEMTG